MALNGFPVFLVGLEARRCVVIGGGAEALRKARELRHFDARVVLIAETVIAALREMAATGEVEWLARDYRDGDLAGVALAVVAEAPEAVRETAWREATRRGVLINSLDDIPRCTCIAGATVRRGPLTIAITSNGAAPAATVRLRQRLDALLGEAWGDALEAVRHVRPVVADALPDAADRRCFWYGLVDGGWMNAMDADDAAGALALLDKAVSRLVAQIAAD